MPNDQEISHNLRVVENAVAQQRLKGLEPSEALGADLERAARGDYAQVADIFAHTFDLHLLYPQRKRLHLSEVTNFMGVVGLYFLATGNRELAEHYDMFLQQIAPEFPITRRLHKKLFPGLLRRLWHGVTGRMIRS